MEHYFTNNPNLKSELRTLKYSYQDIDFNFYSDNGVFSKDGIDFGSRLLIETILKQTCNYKNILDIGCGYGFMGIALSKILKIPVTMSDINKRALHLTEKNIICNAVDGKILESSAYDNVVGEFDLIVTNPPIRAGKDIVLEILNGASKHLNDDGELWFVMRKDHGVKSTINHIGENYLCEIIEKSKGFYIVKAKKR